MMAGGDDAALHTAERKDSSAERMDTAREDPSRPLQRMRTDVQGIKE